MALITVEYYKRCVLTPKPTPRSLRRTILEIKLVKFTVHCNQNYKNASIPQTLSQYYILFYKMY